MKAVTMKRSKGVTEFQKIMHSIEMSFFAGLKSASIYHFMEDKTIDNLLVEGFDVLAFRTHMGDVLLYEVVWSKAKEGRKGNFIEVIAETQDDVRNQREALLKRFYNV